MRLSLGAFYRRIKARAGAPKAITATAHKIARSKAVRLSILQKSLKRPIFVCNIFLVSLSSSPPCLVFTQILKTYPCETPKYGGVVLFLPPELGNQGGCVSPIY
jgi:hypothetical protein